MISKTLTKIFGTKHERDMKRLQPLIAQINSLEPGMIALSNDQLKGKTTEFKERFTRGENLDSLLPEAFAACREAAKRVLGMRHYDVQLIGAHILHQGAIAEMKTGEGKTLVATLAVYLNALSGKGVHVVTVNDYLAKRDTEWMGQMYNWMGLSTGTIVHDLTDRERKVAYGADITYGTNNEFGFDYLRDNMKFSLEDYVQRELNFAIVDECDSILIDEARTPLIISGPKEESTDKYYEVNKAIPHLQRDVHFVMEEKSKTASLTEEGNSKVEELLGIENLYDPTHISLLHHIYQALKAHHLYKRDVEYMVKDDEVLIVDEFTGRLMPGRRWSDGLHQAIEAKEGVKVRNENQTLATITFQNYFRMYNKLAGMTGTAETEAEEFRKIYKLEVYAIPTNRKMTRVDEDDLVYKSEKGKFSAIVKDIVERKTKGQPVLVGTVSIDRSERISRLLRDKGITHNVLNAKHHEREAEIIAQAGRKGSITIATNMAGRGTDILLGGNPENLAKNEQLEAKSPEDHTQILNRYKQQCEAEKQEVIQAGGLYIIGTERHESRRIDNQLRGRAGRQGDPGESRFYLSLEDDLMRIFNGERIQKIMNTLKVPDDEPIVAGMVSRAIEGAQKKVEGHQFDVRKHLLEYDDVMNQQRTAIYRMRRQALAGQDTDKIVWDMASDVTSTILDTYVPSGVRSELWDMEGLKTVTMRQYGRELILDASQISLESVTGALKDLVSEVINIQKTRLGSYFEQVARMLLLQTIDARWKDHLEYIDRIKEGINLRAYAQKDPLIEYKKEAFKAFDNMNDVIMSEVIEKLIKIQVVDSDVVATPQRLAVFDDSQFDYKGAEPANTQRDLTRVGEAARHSPMSPTEDAQQFDGYLYPAMSRGESSDGPRLNREKRRQLQKKKKRR